MAAAEMVAEVRGPAPAAERRGPAPAAKERGPSGVILNLI